MSHFSSSIYRDVTGSPILQWQKICISWRCSVTRRLRSEKCWRIKTHYFQLCKAEQMAEGATSYFPFAQAEAKLKWRGITGKSWWNSWCSRKFWTWRAKAFGFSVAGDERWQTGKTNRHKCRQTRTNTRLPHVLSTWNNHHSSVMESAGSSKYIIM